MSTRDPVKVLMLEAGGWGGICHYTYNLCRALKQPECRPILLTGTPYELAHLPRDFQLVSTISPDAPYLQKLKRVAHCFRTVRPDLVHVQSTFSARKDWLFLLALRIFGCPIVFTAHNLLPHDAHERNAPGMHSAYRLIYTCSHRIIVHGQTLRKTLNRQFSISPRKISVIPHGDYTFTDIKNPIGPETAKQWMGVAAGDRVILAFGAMRAYKGIPDLIEAFARVARTVPNVILAIVGTPQKIDPEAYRTQIRRENLEHRIIFKPEYVPFEDISRYFQSCDIAVYPYRAIAQSGALQLAYAFAKPVVVTRVGAFPETVVEDENGLIVPPGDPKALSGALLRLLNQDPATLSRMGQQSRKLAADRYSWDKIGDRTFDLYANLLSLARSGRRVSDTLLSRSPDRKGFP